MLQQVLELSTLDWQHIQTPESTENEGRCCRPGRLLRCSVGARGIQLVDGEPTGADLKYEGLANQRRGRADVISKVGCFPLAIFKEGA